MTTVGIIDYGMGNLHSVRNAVEHCGARAQITSDTTLLSECDKLILPGVGAFPDAMDRLRETGIRDFLHQNRKPLLGICLGMQLLFDIGTEFGRTAGLGLIPGEVVKMRGDDKRFKIPHMGWNSLTFPTQGVPPCVLLDGLKEGCFVYFVHSYKAVVENRADLAAYTDYGDEVTAVVHRGNIYGTQFHPEKSEETGLAMLKNFLDKA